MADIPEVEGPNRNENDCPQLMGSAPQKSCLTSSLTGVQHPVQFDKAGMNLVAPSATALTADSSGKCSSSAQLSKLDIDHLIRSCDLKSEEITSLMAEKLPSSESEEGSFTTLNSETKDTQNNLMVDATTSTSEITTNPKLDMDTMQAWLAEVSDDSAMSSWREPLIPLDSESDMEEFGDVKGNVKFTEFDIDKKESFVNDLINLNESQEKILEPVPNQTAVASEGLMDIVVESPPNQTAKADKSLVDIEVESANNQTAIASKSPVDIVIEPVPKKTNVTNENLLDIEAEPATNQTAIENKSPVDIVIEPLSKEIDVTNKSLLDIKIEDTAPRRNQDSNMETKKIAQFYIELIKDTLNLNPVFQEAEKLELIQTTVGTEANALKTLEEELRTEAESNFQIRKAARSLAEIGFPKVNISDTERIIKDENFTKNCKKVVVTSFIEPSVSNELEKENDNLFQSVKTDEELKEPIQRADSDEYVDAVSIQDSPTLNNMEKNTLGNNIATEMDIKDSIEINSTSESIKDEMIKKNLKKRVTFADRKGEPGMEHMALLQEEPSKFVETQLDSKLETSLRFLTETYTSHEDDEMLPESLNATLESSAPSRHRRGSPRVRRRAEDPQRLFEELKTLEGVEQPATLPISPCQSPERSEFADSTTKDNKTSTKKLDSKFSKFFKCVRKKIFS